LIYIATEWALLAVKLLQTETWQAVPSSIIVAFMRREQCTRELVCKLERRACGTGLAEAAEVHDCCENHRNERHGRHAPGPDFMLLAQPNRDADECHRGEKAELGYNLQARAGRDASAAGSSQGCDVQ
jgi:hypothetical protein